MCVCVCVFLLLSFLSVVGPGLWEPPVLLTHTVKTSSSGATSTFIVVCFCQVCVVIGSNELSFAEEPSFPHPLSLAWNLKAPAEFKSRFTLKWTKKWRPLIFEPCFLLWCFEVLTEMCVFGWSDVRGNCESSGIVNAAYGIVGDAFWVDAEACGDTRCFC